MKSLRTVLVWMAVAGTCSADWTFGPMPAQKKSPVMSALSSPTQVPLSNTPQEVIALVGHAGIPTASFSGHAKQLETTMLVSSMHQSQPPVPSRTSTQAPTTSPIRRSSMDSGILPSQWSQLNPTTASGAQWGQPAKTQPARSGAQPMRSQPFRLGWRLRRARARMMGASCSGSRSMSASCSGS